jgi:hypothetical protein
MSRPSLVFLTRENEAELKVAADMRGYFAEQEKLKRETDEGKN